MFLHSPTMRYLGSTAGFELGTLYELSCVLVGHLGPLAWVLSVHTIQQLMLDEFKTHTDDLQHICFIANSCEVMLYATYLDTWMDEVQPPASDIMDTYDDEPNRLPDQTLTIAPPWFRTVGRQPGDSSSGSCVSSPRSMRRVMSCSLGLV